MSKVGRPPTTAIVLTARSTSERLPNKAMAMVEGKPLLYWIAKRLDEMGHLILAVPRNDSLAEWGRAEGLEVYEGSLQDVTGRIMDAVQAYAPQAQFVMRGLGDCPFVSGVLVKRALDVMRQYGGDAMAWALPPFSTTVYGATEFPRSRAVWDIINTNAVRDEREHPDLYYHRHRDAFKIIYHEPPAPKYFRPYRLEVDWPEDLELIRRIAKNFGSLPTLEEALDYLDKHEDWKCNFYRSERTGLSVSYTQANRQMWWRLMEGQPVVCWDDSLFQAQVHGEPIFCRAKTCLLGFAADGKLYRHDDVIEGDAYISCACGAGRRWFSKSR